MTAPPIAILRGLRSDKVTLKERGGFLDFLKGLLPRP